MEVVPREMRYYSDPAGKILFEEWYQSLGDRKSKRRIRSRLDRLEDGNFGDHRNLEAGVVELRIHAGPGYRVYIGQDGPVIVVLLFGGSKSRQAADIALATTAWADYLNRRSR